MFAEAAGPFFVVAIAIARRKLVAKVVHKAVKDAGPAAKSVSAVTCVAIAIVAIAIVAKKERRREKRRSEIDPIRRELPPRMLDRGGVAVGPLNPSGVVRINSADYPAKTSGSWVDNGEFVEVVAFDAFGLVVIPLRDIQIQGKP